VRVGVSLGVSDGLTDGLGNSSKIGVRLELGVILGVSNGDGSAATLLVATLGAISQYGGSVTLQIPVFLLHSVKVESPINPEIHLNSNLPGLICTVVNISPSKLGGEEHCIHSIVFTGG
jgi:hypothetical protein